MPCVCQRLSHAQTLVCYPSPQLCIFKSVGVALTSVTPIYKNLPIKYGKDLNKISTWTHDGPYLIYTVHDTIFYVCVRMALCVYKCVLYIRTYQRVYPRSDRLIPSLACDFFQLGVLNVQLCVFVHNWQVLPVLHRN